MEIVVSCGRGNVHRKQKSGLLVAGIDTASLAFHVTEYLTETKSSCQQFAVDTELLQSPVVLDVI
jgi:hypothetical protein